MVEITSEIQQGTSGMDPTFPSNSPGGRWSSWDLLTKCGRRMREGDVGGVNVEIFIKGQHEVFLWA